MYDTLGILGQAAIILGFAASVLGMIAWFRSIRAPQVIGLARAGFHITVTSVFVAAAMLLVLILKHQFQFHYVAAYSSRDLPLGLLMSTFYAGQEGSFLLWTLMVSIVGIVLLFYTQKHDNERETMGVYTGILSFLLLLLIAKNPFAPVEGGIAPADGKGLNPLLQNFWMQIHPPILFLGFASMAPPFALAIAALIKRKYQSWVVSSLPWVVGGAAVLGLGISLGGFWAYETLGWGGWWGWDPVENASLIPWLVSVAMVHTMLVQRRTKGLILTNFLLAILAFVLVLYSTFLTRSGVLGDASVHSFVDPGRFAFTLLVLFMFAFTDTGLALLFGRFTRLGGRLFERYDGWKLLGASYLLIIGPSIPIFAKVSGDVTPIFSDLISTSSPVLWPLFYPLLGIAHILNVLSVLWLPALVLKVLQVGYVLTGRLHSEKEYQSFQMMSRETWIGLGSGVLGVLTFIVLMGTSMPIIPQFIIDALNGGFGWLNGLTGGDLHLGNTVDKTFYDAMALPLAIVMVLMTGFSLVLVWRGGGEGWWRKLALPAGLSVAFTIAVALFGGVTDAGMILLAFAASFSLFSNILVGWFIIRGNPRFAGGYLAHAGVAMMLLGIIGSGFYTTKQSIELRQGVTVEALGHRFTYTGYEPFHDGTRYHFNVRLDDAAGKEIQTVQTVMFVSNYGGQQQIMRNPGIAKFLTTDVYVEPQALLEADPEGGRRFQFTKGHTVQFGDYSVTFTDFDMNNSPASQSFRLGTVFSVARKGGSAEELTAFRTTGPDGVTTEPATVAAGDLQIDVLGMTPNKENLGLSEIEARLKNPAVPPSPADMRETLVVEASLKPFISIVWLGIVLMVAGFFVARMRRAADSRALQTYDPGVTTREALQPTEPASLEAPAPAPAADTERSAADGQA